MKKMKTFSFTNELFFSLSFCYSYRLLNTLKICNWIIHLDDATKTFKAIGKALKSSTISHIKIDGISVLDRNKKHRVEPQFLQTLLSSIPLLRWISVSLSGVSEEQMAFIGNSIGDIKSNEIDIRWVFFLILLHLTRFEIRFTHFENRIRNFEYVCCDNNRWNWLMKTLRNVLMNFYLKCFEI